MATFNSVHDAMVSFREIFSPERIQEAAMAAGEVAKQQWLDGFQAERAPDGSAWPEVQRNIDGTGPFSGEPILFNSGDLLASVLGMEVRAVNNFSGVGVEIAMDAPDYYKWAGKETSLAPQLGEFELDGVPQGRPYVGVTPDLERRMKQKIEDYLYGDWLR